MTKGTFPLAFQVTPVNGSLAKWFQLLFNLRRIFTQRSR